MARGAQNALHVLPGREEVGGPWTLEDERAVHLLASSLALYAPSGAEGSYPSVVGEALQARGFSHVAETSFGLLGSLGEGERTVLLMARLGSSMGWFPSRVDRQVLSGRGVTDSKGPLAMMIEAATRVSARARRSLRIVVVGLLDGETPSFQCPGELVGVVVGEPTGSSRIGCSRWGRVRLRFHVDVPRPRRGVVAVSASERATGWWQRLVAARTRDEEQVRTRLLSVACGSDPFLDEAVLEAEVTTSERVELDRIQADALLLARELGGRVEIRDLELPVVGSNGGALVHAFAAGGIRPEDDDSAAASLMARAASWCPGVPVVAYGPADGCPEDPVREEIATDEYLDAIRSLTATLEKLAAG